MLTIETLLPSEQLYPRVHHHSGPRVIGHSPYISATHHQEAARKLVTSQLALLSRPDITPRGICHGQSTPSFAQADIVAYMEDVGLA
jgi:hypothetical protein